jgi:hypothetical protein
MIKFVKKLSLFISCFVLLVITLDLLSSEFYRNKIAFKLPLSSHYIAVGHSHLECSLNDSLINNFTNTAQSGESYFYTYFKTKNIIENNTDIKTVFISFTNNQVSISDDKKIWGDLYLNAKYYKYASLLEPKDKWVLLKNNPLATVRATSLPLQKRFRSVLSDKETFSKTVGGYLYLVRNKTDSIVNSKNIDKNNLSKTEALKISETNIVYLKRLIDYLKKHDIQVLFIRAPLHPYHESLSFESDFIEFRKTKFPEITFLDFSKFPITNSEFGDLGHLNFEGATKFSKSFNELLENGLINSENPQKIIDQKISVLKEMREIKQVN